MNFIIVFMKWTINFFGFDVSQNGLYSLGARGDFAVAHPISPPLLPTGLRLWVIVYSYLYASLKGFSSVLPAIYCCFDISGFPPSWTSRQSLFKIKIYLFIQIHPFAALAPYHFDEIWDISPVHLWSQRKFEGTAHMDYYLRSYKAGSHTMSCQ